MPKINQSIETQVINEKGELVSKRANKTLSWGAEPPFIKMYLDDIIYLKDMPKSYSPILHEFLKRMTYAGEKEGQVIYVNSSMKRRVQEALGYKNLSSINNAITDLVKAEVFLRLDLGCYLVNPYLFGKGDWQDIDRLRLEINYDSIKGKTFKTICDYKDQIENTLSQTGTEA